MKRCLIPRLVGLAKGQKYYQYTAIDEFSRYIESFPEPSTYSSTLFLTNLIKFFSFPIECVQTDNGAEFTNRLRGEGIHLSLFEKELVKQGIRHKLIRPAKPSTTVRLNAAIARIMKGFILSTPYTAWRICKINRNNT